MSKTVEAAATNKEAPPSLAAGIRREKLSQHEQAELLRLSRGQRAARRLCERAAMVLCVEAGKSLYAIERAGGPKKNTVRKSVERFHHRRQKDPGRPVKESLCDAEREGRPPEFPAEQCVRLMSLSTAEPQAHGVPHSHWSCRELSRVVVRSGRFSHLSKSHVLRGGWVGVGSLAGPVRPT